MACYEIGVRTSGVASASAALELRSGTKRARVHELGITLQAATATTLGLGRPANTPAGGTNNPPLATDAADSAALAGAYLAGWSTVPTAPTSFLRRIGFPATIGSGAIWTFRNLIIPVSASIVLWNLAANGVLDIWAVLEDL